MSGEITIGLNTPGMTALHKVGLAGLWMTLDAFENEYSETGDKLQNKGLSWEKNNTSVTLAWSSEDLFSALFSKAFRIDNNGLVQFPGLGDTSDFHNAVILQDALLGTLLSYGKHRKADKSTKKTGSWSDENTGDVFVYRKVKQYNHQDKLFSPKKINGMHRWLFPGAVQRHYGLGKSVKLDEFPERALALRFLPVGGIFFKICQIQAKRAPMFSLVIPEIRDLANYSECRRDFKAGDPESLVVSGPIEAAFRVLATAHMQKVMDDVDVATCRVHAFGPLPWNRNFYARMRAFTVTVRNNDKSLTLYRLIRGFFAAEKRRRDEKSRRVGSNPREPNFDWIAPQTPELVVRNLSRGVDWWRGFADFTEDSERRKIMFGNNERRGLVQMANDNKTILPEGRERDFVLACHRAWKVHAGRASRFRKDYDQEREKWRVRFSRCRSKETIRRVITDFWARAGHLSPLQNSGYEVMTVFDDWKAARDLAVFALASYKGKKNESEQENDE